MFNYVNITTCGSEGMLNLFFGDHCVALVSDIGIADEIRASTHKRGDPTAWDKREKLKASNDWSIKDNLWWHFKYGYRSMGEAYDLLECDQKRSS